jgi:HK97 family phage prohead protease
MPDGTIPDLVTRSHGLHVRAVREAAREADFVASTDTIDAYDEVIDQASWRLDAFKRNPVILYGHNSRDLPIGQATRCEVVNDQLEVTIKFATEDANPEAEKVWLLVQQKVLRAVSVGFRPTDGKYELRDGKEVFVLYGCDLREVSVVAIGANPDALAKMKSLARAAADHHRQDTSAAPAAPTTTPSNDGGQETRMDLKELQARIDALTLEKAQAQLAEKTATEKATAEATRATTAEARVKTLEAETATLKAEKATLDTELAKASADRDTAVKRAEDAEDKLIAVEVDTLIGKKIAPTEKDDFVALRKNSPELFASMVAKRADMKLTERVTTPDIKAAPNGVALGGDTGVDLWNKL